MLITDAQAAVRRGYSVKIIHVKDNAVETGTTGEGGCPHITRRVDLTSYVSLRRRVIKWMLRKLRKQIILSLAATPPLRIYRLTNTLVSLGRALKKCFW